MQHTEKAIVSSKDFIAVGRTGRLEVPPIQTNLLPAVATDDRHFQPETGGSLFRVLVLQLVVQRLAKIG
jgi:hypothetical protein